MPNVTIYDIAERAGVSAATVSRVINDSPHVKPATRARVKALLEEANYVPNENARGLVSQTSKLVGILVTDIRTTQHTDGIYYIQREFSARGYACIIFNTGRTEEEQVRTIELVYRRKVDAVILLGSMFQNEAVKQALVTYLPGIPIAFCNGSFDLPNVMSVVADERDGVHRVVRMLSDRGRSHIAFVVAYDTVSNRNKESGYRDGVMCCCPDTEPLTVRTGNTAEAIGESLAALLTEHPETDGIVFAEDVFAVMGLRALQKLGKRVPEEISVVGINNTELAEYSVPALTSLDNSIKEISITAVNSILRAFAGQNVPPLVLIPTNLVEREST